MSNQIGRASILLTVDTASFETSMSAARATTGKTFDDIKADALDMGRQVKAGLAVASAAFAATSATVGVFARDQMALASAISKTAIIAGTSATQIQKYIVASKAMGIEQDKLGDIFKDTQDKVGDFLTTGGGELKDFFENIAPKIGITAKELRHLSGPDALQAVYDALEKANISQSEMIFYMESIADEASLLIPLLADGGAGFELWSQAAENAGAVMGEKTIRATQELNTSTQLLDLSYQGVKNQIALGVMPVISDLAGNLVKDASLKEAAAQAGEILAGSLKVIAGTGRGTIGVLQLMGIAIGGLGAAIANPLQSWEILQGTWDDMKKAVDNTNAALDRILNAGKNGTNSTVKALTDITVASEKAKLSLSKTGAEEAAIREAAKNKEKENQKKASAASKAQASQNFKLNPNSPESLKIGVYNAYRKAGLTHKQAVAITAEVGRENDFSPNVIFGYHNDLNQKGQRRVNVGMLSWNGNRGAQLEKELQAKGLLKNKTMSRSQASLDAMAQFSVKEMRGTYKGVLNNFWNNPNADYETLAKEMGGKNSYVGWAMYQNTVDGKAFDWRKHHNKRARYAQQIDSFANVYQPGGVIDKDIAANALSDLALLERQQAEALRLAERQADARYGIEKGFADKKTQLLLDYQEQEKKIKDAAFGEEEQKYLDMAKSQYENKLAWLELEHDKQIQTAKEHLQSEEERIKAEAELERREVRLTVELDEELRQAKIDAITHAEIAAIVKLREAYQAELDEINSYNQTELARIRADYAKRRNDLNNRTDLTVEQRTQLGDALGGAERHQIAQMQQGARSQMMGMQAELGGYSQMHGIKEQYQARLDTIKGFLDAEVATVEEAEKMKQMVRMQYAQDMLGSLAESSKAAFGEQSKVYRAMFAMEQGVAIARSVMAIQQAIAFASANPFPMNLVAMATVAAQTMGIVAKIKAIRNPVVGQAHDGIMSVPKSGTWNLEKGERVLPKHTAQNLDNTLNNIKGGKAVNVIIHNHTGEKVQQTTDANGDIRVIVGQELAKQLPQHVNNPYSDFNKSLKQNYNLERKL